MKSWFLSMVSVGVVMAASVPAVAAPASDEFECIRVRGSNLFVSSMVVSVSEAQIETRLRSTDLEPTVLNRFVDDPGSFGVETSAPTFSTALGKSVFIVTVPQEMLDEPSSNGVLGMATMDLRTGAKSHAEFRCMPAGQASWK